MPTHVKHGSTFIINKIRGEEVDGRWRALTALVKAHMVGHRLL